MNFFVGASDQIHALIRVDESGWIGKGRLSVKRVNSLSVLLLRVKSEFAASTASIDGEHGPSTTEEEMS